MSRLRVGEWVAAIGAAGLFITLFFDWFRVQAPLGTPPLTSGWSSLGWFMDLLLCISMLGGASLAYMTLKRTAPAWPMGAGMLTWALGGLIWLILLVRVTIAQPGVDAYVSVQAPAYLGLFFALAIPVGAFLSIRDERTHTAEARAYMPPPARTAP
jgi:hypothetical protein